MITIDKCKESGVFSNSGQIKAGDGYGHTFMGNGSALKTVKFYLSKTGTPTGNIAERIFRSVQAEILTDNKSNGFCLHLCGVFIRKVCRMEFFMCHFMNHGLERLCFGKAAVYDDFFLDEVIISICIPGYCLEADRNRADI